MKRTTISLTDELADALEREARRNGVSASAVARAALTSHLGMGGANDRRRLPFAAVGRGGRSTTARDMEELLAKEWSAVARGR